ncbi:MAG: hypothetical protein KU38_01050 [Sulfurovum sp. FS08-3]|nr:MAG: hypothetical protein KU38_01050 [Sulfurovum sp. FS08-3]
MHLDVTAPMLLSQLGYPKSEAALSQMQDIINNTKGFDKFAKHIISLDEHLKHMKAYVAMSNSLDYLKIKCDISDAPLILQEFHDTVLNWSQKYNVEVQKIKTKEVYYIIGHH